MMEVLFINHSSMLLKSGDQYLWADPWHMKVAFSSWLPSMPMSIHPCYIAALDNVSILISHFHGDHADTDVLRLFDKRTPVVSRFPWVGYAVKQIGLENFHLVDETGFRIQGVFQIKSYQTEIADAIYTVEADGSMVVLANDNWTIPQEILASIKLDVDRIGGKNVLYCSQVGSASGWPLNYRCYSNQEKALLLREKIAKMANTASDNADKLGLDGFAAYAGYALPFVEGKDYITPGINPTPANVKVLAPKANIVDFLPGDVYDFETPVIRAFTGNRGRVAEKARLYYEMNGMVPEYDDYVSPGFSHRLHAFLVEFNEYSKDALLGKTLGFVIDGIPPGPRIEFGFGIGVNQGDEDKTLYVASPIMDRVLRGEMLFEALYTGYLGEWERYPADKYNQDLVDVMVGFSYVWMDKIKNQQKEAA